MQPSHCTGKPLSNHAAFRLLARGRTQFLQRLFSTAVCIGIVASFSGTAVATERITVGRLRVELERVVDRPPTSTIGVPTVYMDTANDDSGRLFFGEQSGKIRILQNGTWSTLLDLSGETLFSGPRGLLGFTFHPEFANSASPGYHKLYTFHSVDPLVVPGTPDFTSPGGVSHHNLVTEWTIDATNPNLVDVSSRREIFRQEHGDDEHSGGMLEFGPDGDLYGVIGTPAEGTAFLLQAQDLSSMHGKYYRIDPINPTLTPTSTDPISANGKYRIPADNPFISTPGALDEIYAYGARNPYRFSIDPDTGYLFAGDVGQFSREEFSAVPAGGNLGWPYREGTVPGAVSGGTGPFVEPLADYTHEDGRSAIGGYIYRGSIPALQGMYIMGEFSWGNSAFFTNRGRLLYMDVLDDEGNLRDPSELGIQEMARSASNCSESYLAGVCTLDMTLLSFGTDDDGELYAVGVRQGRVVTYKFVDAFFLPEGDFDEDGVVDDDDYADWKSSFGGPVEAGAQVKIGYGADGNRDGMVDAADYVMWRKFQGLAGSGANGFSNVPEPTALASILIVTLISFRRRRYAIPAREEVRCL